MELERLFWYNRNSIGSRIEPCGTPEVTGSADDVAPSTAVVCCVLQKIDVKLLLLQGALRKSYWRTPSANVLLLQGSYFVIRVSLCASVKIT